MSIKERRLHVDSPDVAELKKKWEKVFKFKSKNLFEPCNYWPVLTFITLSVLILKVFFKIKSFLGNQIEATKEEIKVLVS